MRRVAFLLLGVVGMAGSGLHAAEPPRAAKWVSADEALIYVEVARPDGLLDVATSDRLRGLLKAIPNYDKALDNPQVKQGREVVEYVAKALDTTPEEGLRKLAGGDIVLAVEKPDRAYLIVTPKDAAFLDRAHAKLVELARADAKDKGNPDPVKQEEYRGVTGYSVSDKEDHAILDGRLVVASGGDALKALIDRVKDRGAAEHPLADDALWKARRAAIDPEAAAWAMARLDRLRELDPSKFAPEQVNPGLLFLFGPYFDAARSADWIALGFTWTDRRLAAEAFLPFAAKDSRLAAAYLPEPGQGATKPLRPPGTIASLSIWRDMSALWEARGDVFPPEAQQGFAQLDTFAGQFFGGRDFGSGVLGALGTHWRLVVARQDPKSLDPTPDTIVPAFALVLDLKEEDPDFGDRLEAAFQSFVGLVNLGAAETKAPPLKLGSETLDGVTISTARFQARRAADADEPVHIRHNFGPSAARFDNHFVLGSNTPLVRDLIRALRQPAEPTDATALLAADGTELGKLVKQNREYLINQDVLEKGTDRQEAEAGVELFRKLLEYLGRATYTATSADGLLRVKLNHDLGP